MCVCISILTILISATRNNSVINSLLLFLKATKLLSREIEIYRLEIYIILLVIFQLSNMYTVEAEPEINMIML